MAKATDSEVTLFIWGHGNNVCKRLASGAASIATALWRSHMEEATEYEVYRYFFHVCRIDREDSDLRGVMLPNDAAVLDHALCIIKDLRQGGEHNDPGLMMIVRNESLKTVLSLPFLAGYA